MTFSPLISGTVPNNGKYSSRQGRPVSKIVQHHWAGTGGGIERMAGPDEASTTYLILTDGRILGHVPEEFRPWTSGSFEADGDAITIEVQNTSGQVNGNDNDPSSWMVSDAAYNSIIALLADVAHRYGWGDINSSNYRGHREFSSTACPGGYLWSRMGNTRAAARALFSGGALAAQGGTTTTSTLEGFLMALNEKDQQNIYEAITRIDAWVRGEKKDVIHGVLFGNRVDGRNIVDTGRQSLANEAAILAALSGLKAGTSITADDIAAAIPEGIAQQVADLLAKRLEA